MPPTCATILVVDDEEVVLTLETTVLLRAEFHVLSAASAREALIICREHPKEIDLALVDVVMPDMKGTELAKRLRKEVPDVRILFVSGYANEELMCRDLALCRADFIAKPFSPATLVRKVRAALERNSTESQNRP
jgi:two-component system, cell cycle sensor histidine kinase and response regulator CckA